MNFTAPNLANRVEFGHLEPFALSDQWWMEVKANGVRLALIIKDGKVSGINRRGVGTPVDPRICEAFTGATGEWVFDGEWLDDTFYVFDMPIAPGVNLRTPYHLRRHPLDALLPVLAERCPQIKLLPTHRTTEQKVKLMRWAVDNHAEGVMVKNVNGIYQCGPRRSDAMRKAKLEETLDCFVIEIGREGKQSVAVGLFDGNEPVDVGSAKVPWDVMQALHPNDVLELRYLYVGPDRRLVQPVFLRVRDDKTAAECDISQLKQTSKALLTEVLQ